MRLTALSDAWRAAHADSESPIHEWPVGHLELVAALPEPVGRQLAQGFEHVRNLTTGLNGWSRSVDPSMRQY